MIELFLLLFKCNSQNVFIKWKSMSICEMLNIFNILWVDPHYEGHAVWRPHDITSYFRIRDFLPVNIFPNPRYNDIIKNYFMSQTLEARYDEFWLHWPWMTLTLTLTRTSIGAHFVTLWTDTFKCAYCVLTYTATTQGRVTGTFINICSENKLKQIKVKIPYVMKFCKNSSEFINTSLWLITMIILTLNLCYFFTMKYL
jgi:hypothetical protein